MDTNELKVKWYDLTHERDTLVKETNARLEQINQELTQVEAELNPAPQEG